MREDAVEAHGHKIIVDPLLWPSLSPSHLYTVSSKSQVINSFNKRPRVSKHQKEHPLTV